MMGAGLTALLRRVISFSNFVTVFVASVVARNFRQGVRQSVAFLLIHPC